MSGQREALIRVLAAHWGCGPGEILTETVGADVDGGPGEIAVGQMCRSSAHTYAYWGPSCQFATEAADAILASLPEAGVEANAPTPDAPIMARSFLMAAAALTVRLQKMSMRGKNVRAYWAVEWLRHEAQRFEAIARAEAKP